MGFWDWGEKRVAPTLRHVGQGQCEPEDRCLPCPHPGLGWGGGAPRGVQRLDLLISL